MVLSKTTTAKVGASLFLLKNKGRDTQLYFLSVHEFALWSTELIQSCGFRSVNESLIFA